MAYTLEIPEELSSVHSTFHVSNLKKYLSDEFLVILMKELWLDDMLNFMEEPVEIMDREVKQLSQSRIPIIKGADVVMMADDVGYGAEMRRWVVGGRCTRGVTAWGSNAFKKVASMFGKFKFFDSDVEDSMSLGRVCIATKKDSFIAEIVKVVIHGVTFDVHVKEIGTWSTRIKNDLDCSDFEDGDDEDKDRSYNMEENHNEVLDGFIEKVVEKKVSSNSTNDVQQEKNGGDYVDALTAIDEPVKDKDLVMLAVSGLHEEYNSLKTTITARQSPTTFSELHALLKFVTQLSALVFQVSSIAPSGPQAFYGAHPSNNNRSNNNNNHRNSNNSCGNKNNRGHSNDHQFDWASTQNTVYGTCNRCGVGHIPSQSPNRDLSTIRTRPSTTFANTRAQSSNATINWHSDTRANSHVTPGLEAMDNLEAYYDDDALHVGNGKGLPILHIGSSKVYPPQKTISLKNILHVPEIFHNLLLFKFFVMIMMSLLNFTLLILL
ncbi:nucleotide-binding alpha-beta plait domain-containing protein [Tanacetum coccineum]|uniref:Nucleotide-binding alpha-beta plait domain-containing protein n=1 Tax=Tanacetum coccineum TaxID=301880 RepID=A0ABQ5DGY2_9ASTR